MERLVVNLTGRARKTTLNGREYLVAPASLIVPGVLNGSHGPGLYTEEENRRSVGAWNGTPIVVYHPSVGGSNISARDPDVIDSQGVGTVYRAKSNGKLSAEAWFDVAALDKVDAKLTGNIRIRPRLEAGQPVELSTGLSLDREPVEGTFNGESYTFVARNYRPDHLAVLPDQVGACSLSDGCGVLVNGKYDLALVTNAINRNTKEEVKTMDALTAEQRTELIEGLIANCDCWDEEDREVLNGLGDEKLNKLTENVAKSAKNAETKKNGGDDMGTVLKGMSDEELDSEMKRRSSGKKATENKDAGEPGEPLTAEQWLNKAPDEVKNTFRYAHQIEQEQKEGIISKLVANVTDTADKRIQSERLMQRSLEDLRNDLALVPTQPTENAGTTENTVEGDGKDGAWLSSMVSRLGKEPDEEPLLPPTINWGDSESKSAPTVTAAIHSSDDSEKWLASAPAGVKLILENAMKIEHRERDELVSQLVGNIEDTNHRFRMRDKLENKPLSELRDMIEMMPKTAGTPPKPNYTGAAAPVGNTKMSDDDKEDILPLPTMDLAKQA